MSRPIGANSESRPSDLWANGSKPKPTIPRSGSSGPTMRVKEVALAPGAKTRSHLQLMQNTHRAATGGWTSSSIHPPDSHMLHGTRAPQQHQPDNGAFPLQEGASNGPTPAYLDPSASNPLENNLRQQRDLLASQMDMMRQSRENYPPPQTGVGSPNGQQQQPLMGALPPLTAPYGSQCCASQPPFSAVGKYNTTYLGGQIGGGVVPNRLGTGPSSTALLQKKINSGSTSAQGSKKAREEIESLQTALQEQNDEMDRLRSENEQLRIDCDEARRTADEVASRQNDSEQRVHAAQRAMDRAKEMQRRAEVALEHQSETIDSIQKEAMMYRLEWERCLEYMAKFGGIGKDYHNDHAGDRAVGMNQEALMEASKRHLTEDDGVTDENCAELVNRILQGDHSLIPPMGGNGSREAAGGALYPVPSQNAVDPATASNGMVGVESGPPHRLVLGDSPHGTEGGGVACGRLGLVALAHRLMQEHANVVAQLKASRERNHSLIISLQQVNQREAHSAAEMVALENEFQKGQERLRVGEVLLADVRGEAEYLRGIVGEHTETISRLMREVSGLQARVRDEVGQRAAAEGRVDAAEDTSKKAAHDITQREMIYKKDLSEMQYELKCLHARLLESENAKAAISHEKDHIAYQLNHVRTTIAKKLDGLLEAGTGRDTGEAVRQAQERAAREAGQLAQTIASLRNELFADCPAPPPPPFVQPHPQQGNNNVNTSYHAPHDNFPPDASHQPVDYRAAHPQQSHNTSYQQNQINQTYNNQNPAQSVPVDYTAPSHQYNHTVAPPPAAPGGVSLYHGSIKAPKGDVDPAVALKEASSSKEHRREAAEARAAAQNQIQTKNSETSSVAMDQGPSRVSTPPQPKAEGGEV